MEARAQAGRVPSTLMALAPLSTPEKRNKNIQLSHLCSHAHQLNATLRDNTSAQMQPRKQGWLYTDRTAAVRMHGKHGHLQHPEAPCMPQPQRAASLAWLGLFCIRASRAVCPLPLASSGLSVLFGVCSECYIQQWLSYSRAASGTSIHLSTATEFLWLATSEGSPNIFEHMS